MMMAHWKSKRHESIATFNLFFRKAPFGGNHAILAGLNQVIELLDNFGFSDEDIDYLASLKKNDHPIFELSFLRYLKKMKFNCNVMAVPEGTIVFANEPLLQITGPIIQCQLLETAFLNAINFQTLIATKASRICKAAGDDPVFEFGLRRAQGIDGGVSASRAAYIGGCAGTSNVQAGKKFGIPVVGTHAHSFVMSFDSELEAFEAYAHAMPDNCTFLVDTYDTFRGVANAITIGLELRKRGFEMSGIRLDSGNLLTLSTQARALLDRTGFNAAKIVASNDLDEHKIAELKAKSAPIDIWGVGTKLVTGDEQPALGGVYKLGRLDGIDKIKLSDDSEKTTNPGVLQTLRYIDNDKFVSDLITNQSFRGNVEKSIKLERAVYIDGRKIVENESMSVIRNRREEQSKQFTDIDNYMVKLDSNLLNQKEQMILNLKKK